MNKFVEAEWGDSISPELMTECLARDKSIASLEKADKSKIYRSMFPVNGDGAHNYFAWIKRLNDWLCFMPVKNDIYEVKELIKSVE